MTDRDVFRNLAKLASKKQNKRTLLWLISMNQRSLKRKGGLLHDCTTSRNNPA